MNAEFVLLSFANYYEIKMFKIKIGDYWHFCCYKPFFNFTETVKEYKKYIKKNAKYNPNDISEAQDFLKNYLHHEIRDLYVLKKNSVIMIYGFWRKYERNIE